MKLKYGLTYPTWQGVYLVGIFISLCIAAMMRQINLLLFIAGLLLGPLILSWFMVKIKKSWFRIQRRMPETIHAESEFILSLDLTSVSRGTLFALAARQIIFENREQGTENDCGLRAVSCENSISYPSALTLCYFFSKIHPNQKQTQKCSCRIDRPGEYRLEPIELISRFPLGLFECRVRVGRAATFWVYPALLKELPEDLIQMTALSWYDVSRETQQSSGRVGDFLSVAAYRPGEDVRLIHWRSSARLGNLVIRRFQPSLSAWLGIVINMTPPDGWDENESDDLPEEIRSAIKTAATVINKICIQQTENVGKETQIVLALTTSPDNILSGPTNAAFYHQAMRVLASARLTASRENKTAETLAAVKELVPDGTKVIVLGEGEPLSNS